jgi:hypothetical protein
MRLSVLASEVGYLSAVYIDNAYHMFPWKLLRLPEVYFVAYNQVRAFPPTHTLLNAFSSHLIDYVNFCIF